MRGYMMLWDAEEWEVNYALVDTPERLIGFEPIQMHVVSHIPEHLRLTTWRIKRDFDKEHTMITKVKAAREYYAEIIEEFDCTHRIEILEAAWAKLSKHIRPWATTKSAFAPSLASIARYAPGSAPRHTRRFYCRNNVAG